MVEKEGRRNGRPPHVLALPFPFHGHINPLLHLACDIAAAGATVSFLNIFPHYHSRMPHDPPSRNLHFLSLPSLSSAHGPPDLRVPGSIQQCFAAIASPQTLSAVQSLVVEEQLASGKEGKSPLSCLIADMSIPFAHALALALRIPRIDFWTQSAASFAYHLKVAEGFEIPADELALITGIVPGLPPHRRAHVPKLLLPEVAGEFLVDYVIRPFTAVRDAAAVVVNTFQALEESTIEALRAELAQGTAKDEDEKAKLLAVGPLHYSSAAQAEARDLCLCWLDSQPLSSVLYVSFGTLVCLGETEFEELALGLEASEQPFLWALRPDLVCGNPSQFLEAFRVRMLHRGLIVPWAPQLTVLIHPAVCGFLTHCGWNSILEGISAGVPLIGRPKLAEQDMNLLCIEQLWHIGLGLHDEPLTRDHVEQTIRLFHSRYASLAEDCAKFKEAAFSATSSQGSSLTNLRSLLELLYHQLVLNPGVAAACN